MKAYLFSIGESTTDISKWSLERLGFKVVLLYDQKTSFSEKYQDFLDMAYRDSDEWVVRGDADIIYNKNMGELLNPSSFSNLWMAFQTFCFLKMDIISGTPMLMHKDIIAEGLKYKNDFFSWTLRPETEFWRRPEIVGFTTHIPLFVGIHGYKQYNEDIKRVMEMKGKRQQLEKWDIELINKINSL